jgi:hypothetical protein
MRITCDACYAIYYSLVTIHLYSNARVVEWQTRTFEGRMPKGMRVQVPPRAPTHAVNWPVR